MLLYNKHIIKHLFMPVTVITLTLTGIVWLTQSLRFIDLIVNKGLNISTFLYLSALLIPSLLMLILPLALFISVLMVYNRFISDSEIIVLKSAGLSRVRLALPAVIVASVILIISYLISLYILPASYREFKDTQAFIRNNYASVLLQEGVFSTPTKGLTVYIESRGSNGLLKGIFVHDSRDSKNPTILVADEGRLVRTDTGPRFDLYKGHSQRIDPATGNILELNFDSDQYDLSVYTDAGTRNWRTAEERYLRELFFPKDVKDSQKNKYIAEGHYRIVWPLFCLVLTLIAVAALFSGQFNRRGQWKRMASATIIAAFITASVLVLKGVVASHPSLAILMYMNVVIPIAISLYILFTHRIINSANIFKH